MLPVNGTTGKTPNTRNINEPPHEKTNNLHMRKQRRRSASRISAFDFATRIVHFLFFVNPKFQASSLLCNCTGRFVSDLFGNHIVGFPTRRLKCRIYKGDVIVVGYLLITKTCPCNIQEFFLVVKNLKFHQNFFLYFSYFCSKYRLWVLVRTASAR